VFRPDEKTRLIRSLFFATLLIVAQGALALHAFEHESGAPQGKVCGACITAGQLAAGSMDAHSGESLEPAQHRFVPTTNQGFDSVHAATARQRGPPASS
jgi:hypothetical protein